MKRWLLVLVTIFTSFTTNNVLAATSCLELKGQPLSDLVDCIAAQSDEFMTMKLGTVTKSQLYQSMSSALLFDMAAVKDARRTYRLWGDWLLSNKSTLNKSTSVFNRSYAFHTRSVAMGLADTGDEDGAQEFFAESFDFILENFELKPYNQFQKEEPFLKYLKEVITESITHGMPLTFVISLIERIEDEGTKKQLVWTARDALGTADRLEDYFNLVKAYSQLDTDGDRVRALEAAATAGNYQMTIAIANALKDTLNNCNGLADLINFNGKLAGRVVPRTLRSMTNPAEAALVMLLSSDTSLEIDAPIDSLLGQQYSTDKCQSEAALLRELGEIATGDFDFDYSNDLYNQAELFFAEADQKLNVGDFLGARKAAIEAREALSQFLRENPDFELKDSKTIVFKNYPTLLFQEYMTKTGDIGARLTLGGAKDLSSIRKSDAREMAEQLLEAKQPELAFSVAKSTPGPKASELPDLPDQFRLSDILSEATKQLSAKTDFDQALAVASFAYSQKADSDTFTARNLEGVVAELAKSRRSQDVAQIAGRAREFEGTLGAHVATFWEIASNPSTIDKIEWHECDRLAASVGDRNSFNKGNMYADLDASAAVDACAKAVAEFPLVEQYQFQYGRALLKADRGKEAVSWLRKAATGGSTAAAQSLGIMYLNGLSLPQNDFLAAKWLFRAATEGHVAGQSDMAYLYHTGRGVTPNKTLALRYASLSAAQGWQPAKDLLNAINQEAAQSSNNLPTSPTPSGESDPMANAETQTSSEAVTKEGQTTATAPDEPAPQREDVAVLSQPPEPLTIADVIPFAFNAGIYRAWAELCDPDVATNLRAKTLEAYRARWSEVPTYGTLEADEAFFVKTMDEQYDKQKEMTKTWEGQGQATAQICNEPSTKNTITQTRSAYEELYAKWRATP